ncbi:MAG: exonuclease SbcCD subunit D C-terminal domain-containing protein [Magnetococcales bacterium]|nr:exonuclease SbcCD subunit D C-terminal domain-containing protein [Magnetococcales bacterium]
MRLFHTADWHLGHALNGFDRSHEHQRFFAGLLDRLESDEADALLVAGDVFDKANPSHQAEGLLFQFLAQAKERLPALQMVLTAGNHDSPGRLESWRPLMEPLGVHLVGMIPRNAAGEAEPGRLALPLKNRRGEVGAWCLALPFLRPSDLPPGETFADPAAGVREIYAQALAAVPTTGREVAPVIALGHGHISGGELSEWSERRIVLGGLEALPAAIFDPRLAYVALGHLHKPQRIGGEGRMVYAGSPIPLSFAERDYDHRVVRLDLDASGVRALESIPIPHAVPLLRLPKDQPQSLPQVLALLRALRLPEVVEEQHRPYLEVRVLLDQPQPGLRAEIEAALADKPVRLVQIHAQRARIGGGETDLPDSLEALSRLQPLDLFLRRYHRDYPEGDPSPELRAAFDELLQQPEEADAP